MTTMLSEVYDALRDAQGVSEEKARKAAEAIASYENRFAPRPDQTVWKAGSTH